MSFTQAFLDELTAVVLNPTALDAMVYRLDAVRTRHGRVFLLGLGGSAANASHFAADLRTLCLIRAEALTDSVAEFSATANDAGWEFVFLTMLERRRPREEDEMLVLSVGGGTEAVSLPLTVALRASWPCGIMGIVGRDGGETAKAATVVVQIPATQHVTPVTEAWQLVVAHLLVTHPLLRLPT